MIGQCRTVVGVLQLMTGVFVLAITVMQILLAIRVSAYARMLCRKEDLAQERKMDIADSKLVETEKKLADEKTHMEMA